MPGGHYTTIEVSNIMSFVLYTQILKQSVIKPASPGITLKEHGFGIVDSNLATKISHQKLSYDILIFYRR